MAPEDDVDLESVEVVLMAVEALVADAEGPAVIVTGFKVISPLARVVVSLGCELAPVLGITSVQTAVVVPPMEQTMRPDLEWMQQQISCRFYRLVLSSSAHTKIRRANDLRVIGIFQSPFNRLGTGRVEQTWEESTVFRIHARTAVDAVRRRAGSLGIEM